MSYVAIRNLTKRYDGALALSGIDLEFQKGEFVIIVGPSGCGKSTLLRMIAGLEDITGGEIGLDGERVNELDPVDRGCAMVFQNYALYPHMTVAQNIAYPLRLAGVPKKLRAERARVVAESLGLTPYLDRLPRQLSGGQRQRVAMGRAIVREPKLFLFDEPLSNLDAKMRMQMRVELRRLHRRLAATSILVTHDQIEAMTMADRLVVMNGGRIEQVGAPSEVYDRPASLFVAGFLGSPAMNLIPARIDESGAVATEAAPGVALRGAVPLARGLEFTLGVRPEDFAVVAPDRGGLPAVVDMIEDLGGVKVAHCQLGDRFATAMLGRNHGLREGERVALQPDWSRIHAFETASGRRIDLPVGSPGAIAVA